MSDEQLLRLREVCALLAVSRATLYRMIRRREFCAPIQFSRRRVAWKRSEVLAFIDSRKRGLRPAVQEAA